jgi:hypothetical protein
MALGGGWRGAFTLLCLACVMAPVFLFLREAIAGEACTTMGGTLDYEAWRCELHRAHSYSAFYLRHWNTMVWSVVAAGAFAVLAGSRDPQQ